MAAYLAVLDHGDRILGMNLAHGGHLTHGSPVNFSGRWFEVHAYGVREDDSRIDYAALERQATDVRPKLVVAGASAYPRIIDFERMGKLIANEEGVPEAAEVMPHLLKDEAVLEAFLMSKLGAQPAVDAGVTGTPNPV